MENEWAFSGLTACRGPFRPKVALAAQSVPSRPVLRGGVNINKPMAVPELVWRPKISSLGMLGRGQGSTMTSACFKGVHAEAVVWDCSAGHSTWFIVLNAHSTLSHRNTHCRWPVGVFFATEVGEPEYATLSAESRNPRKADLPDGRRYPAPVR